jgi:hypothetical protein
MERRLRYSERKRLAETGNLGDFVDDSVPTAVLNAVSLVYSEAAGRPRIGDPFNNATKTACAKHFGWYSIHALDEYMRGAFELDDFLDFIEIFAEYAAKTYRYSIHYETRRAVPLPDVEQELNALFERHRFGYRIDDGEVRKLASPALDQTVVGPALMAVQRPGWEEVEQRYREAITHQRGGPDENDDALTAANAALEAALQAAGCKGDRLSALAKSLRGSGLVPSFLEGVPEALDTLIKRSGAMRDTHGDAHAGGGLVPQALVDLAIHWTGAFIVYLSEAAHESSS